MERREKMKDEMIGVCIFIYPFSLLMIFASQSD